MAVYVDQLIDYGKRIGKAGPEWCHLTADSPEELHAFAMRIGLQRHWASDHTQPNSPVLHYDLTRGKRIQAVKRGAIEVDGREHIPAMIEKRRQHASA